MIRAMDETPYWRRFLPEASHVPARDLPDRCEIAIVGGGYTGLSAAIHLAKAGADVALFERDRLGWGASSRNGGQALTGLQLSPETLVERYGLERARRLYGTTLDALDYLEAFFEAEGIECGFSRRGCLWAAFAPGHFEEMKGTEALLAETFGHQTQLVGKAELRGELATAAYHGALLDPLSGGLNPGRYVCGLVETALKYGVRLHENTEIVGIERSGVDFRLATRAGPVSASKVAIATNGYTPDFLGGLRRRIVPIPATVIATEPLDATLAAELIPKRRVVYDSRRGLNYFRMSEDGRLIFGGRAALTDIGTARAAPRVRSRMIEIFPQLAEAEIACAWRGIVGCSLDHMPHIGVADGLYYAMAYCGHGVVNAFYFGSRLALLIQDKLEDFPFLDIAFPTMFLYRRRPWFLPIRRAYDEFCDRLAR